MSHERFGRLAATVAKRAVLSTLVVAPIIQGVRNADVAMQVAKVLSGGHVDCSSGELINGVPKHDLIAVLGAGSYIDAQGNLTPSTFERRRLRLAAEVLVNNSPNSPVLLLDGGEKVGVADAEYLKEQVLEISGGKMRLPDGNIHIGKGFVNTSTSMQYLSGFMEKRNLKAALLLTDSFHMDRAELLGCNFGLNVAPFTVEQGAEMFMPSDLPEINQLNNTPGVRFLEIKEHIEMMTLVFDKDSGTITRLFKSKR